MVTFRSTKSLTWTLSENTSLNCEKSIEIQHYAMENLCRPNTQHFHQIMLMILHVAVQQ